MTKLVEIFSGFWGSDLSWSNGETIGKVRSSLPEHVKSMALTATATKMVQTHVATTLGKEKPIVVALFPCKTNLIYNTQSFTSVRHTFELYSIPSKLSVIKHLLPVIQDVHIHTTTTYILLHIYYIYNTSTSSHSRCVYTYAFHKAWAKSWRSLLMHQTSQGFAR